MPGSSIPPSTLSYKDRIAMAQADGFLYRQLYTHGNTTDVFARLQNDATGRLERLNATGSSTSSNVSGMSGVSSVSDASSGGTGFEMPWQYAKPQSKLFYSKGTDSGFMTNTSRPATRQESIRTSNTYKSKFDQINPKLHTRAKQRDPLEYMVQMRPQAETTNQSMRMLGTYASDYKQSRINGAFIPHAMPGGGPGHPDVIC